MILNYFTLLLSCQLAGELAVALSSAPVPGPVAGMALLFCGLLLKGGVPEGLGRAGDALLGNLSLLFVPAGVGVMLHAGLFRDDWLPISAALVLSTVLTVAVTGLLMTWLNRRTGAGGDRADG